MRDSVTVKDLRETALFAFLLGFSLALAAVEIIDAVKEHAALHELEVKHPARIEFGTAPPDCAHLYNIGRTKEWYACMTFTILPASATRRDDI